MDLAPGTRIELIFMGNDPNPIAPGSKGTVLSVQKWPGTNELQINVKWDSGRGLMLLYPHDKFMVITETKVS
jgi:hypothetical protein